jgi:FkbM family methyltransferase
MVKLKHLVYNVLPKKMKVVFDRKNFNRNKSNFIKYETIELLKATPRYTRGTIKFDQKKIEYLDSASLLFIYDEIFNKQIYNFKTVSQTPIIIDAGANIGMSLIYFKMKFPNAKITAFEPDEEVFNVLKNNVASFEFKEVELVKKGLWKEVTVLTFNSEGADAGRISDKNENGKVIKIETSLLSNYLKSNTIDLLKIDIEGAEFEVLNECKAYLKNVNNIFIEYHSFSGQEQFLPELLGVLKSAGFRLNINAPGLTSMSPFMKLNEYNGMDMQLNIYGMRKINADL